VTAETPGQAGDGFDSPDGRTYSGPGDALEPDRVAAQPDDPYGGHEFHYESHTDLFRCIRCHRYEVSARKDDGTVEPCTGEPPAGSGPIEVNAW